MGYNDFGDFYYAHGALGDAFKNYVRTRDYCTTVKHIIHMCLIAILVSIEMGQFAHVVSYVSKAEQNKIEKTDKNDKNEVDSITIAKLNCASGLAQLEAKKYKIAARKFLETSPELGNNYSEKPFESESAWMMFLMVHIQMLTGTLRSLLRVNQHMHLAKMNRKKVQQIVRPITQKVFESPTKEDSFSHFRNSLDVDTERNFDDQGYLESLHMI